ncbi:phosphatase PAP2 family protein [Actinomadura sp. GTD37]|uniref:phosphatase PAP2 family protein n=1 Tax=Actinomadura sp. GTD37 TaxID=1778030 RepID=UPI0035C1EDAE
MRWGSKGRCALLVAAMVLVTADVLTGGPLRHLDWIVHEYCDAHVRDGPLTAVHLATKLGQRGDLVAVIAPLAVIAAIRTRSPRYVVMSAAIVFGLSLAQAGLKAVIPRTYPYGDADLLFTGGAAYPSGHTLNAFVLVWVVLELLVAAFPSVRLSARRRRGISLATGCVAAAALTVADEHWLTDVLFSLALGPVLLSALIAAEPLTRRAAVPDRRGRRTSGVPTQTNRRAPEGGGN